MSDNKKNLTTMLDKKHIDFLRQLSHKLSLEEGQTVGISELVRRALHTCYKLPTNLD